MRVPRPILYACAALVVGGVLGFATRGRSGGPGRPESVEAVLVAFEKEDPAALRRALDAAGDPERHPSPWREELRMARLVERGDQDALWRFATEGEPGAAKARALVFLVERGRSMETRNRALARMRLDYPQSWTLGAFRPKEDGPR